MDAAGRKRGTHAILSAEEFRVLFGVIRGRVDVRADGPPGLRTIYEELARRGFLELHRPRQERRAGRRRGARSTAADRDDQPPQAPHYRPTDAGRRQVDERASDDAFGLEFGPGRLEPISPRLVWFLDSRGKRLAKIWSLGPSGGQAAGPGSGEVAIITLWENGVPYAGFPVRVDGTCVRPGSPEGGWARLLDLAVSAGLELPEAGG
jgi:hypothetical protein